MADSAPVLDGPNDTGVQVDLDTSGQSTSAPTTNNVCTDTCKFKTKRSGKQHDMIQCSVCAQWYHTDCVGLKKGDPVGVWPFTSCRHIPEQIKTIVESLSTLTAAMNNISNINSNLTKQYETKYAECLARTENKYNRIVICAGTNDCNNEIDIDATTEHLDHLLQQVATERVACGSNVVLSSIPPRTDDVVRQQRVEEFNTILEDVSAKVGVTFISNDKSFRLADGQPHDGYLCKDGLHLNYRGISRLIDNLRLTKLYLLKTANRSTTTKGRRILQNANALLCQVIKDGTTPITTTVATRPTTRSTMAVTVRTQASFHNRGRESNTKLERP